jgi:hypothetical protein
MSLVKVKSTFEKHFKLKPNGLYQEFTLFFVHVVDEGTGDILSSKLDKVILGKLYRKGNVDERAIFGDEITFHFKNEKTPSKMIPSVKLSELSYRKLSF